MGRVKNISIFEQTYPINFNSIILKISVFTELLPIIFYLFVAKRINDKTLRVIFFLLLIGFISNLYGLYRIEHHKNNFLGYNFYLLLETIFLYIFFSKLFYNRTAKKVLLAAAILLIVNWSYLFFTIGNQKFLDFFQTLENLSIFALAIYYFYEQLFKINVAFVYNQPRFWVVTAYLVYSAGTFFLLLFISSLDPNDKEKYYVLNYLFIIIRTSILLIAMSMKNEIQLRSNLNNTKLK